MKKKNKKSCIDVFNAFLVENAKYIGKDEIPMINSTNNLPNELIVFSKCIKNKEYNKWVHFYEHDYQFERVWRNPKRYLDILKKYKGVILSDFSVYRDMPLSMQIWNIYRSRAIGFWLQKNGIEIIPNIRWGDERTYNVSCLGINKNSIIAIGSHGVLKDKEDRKYFKNGLDFIVKKLEPSVIIVYGSTPSEIFNKYIDKGIKIIAYESDISKSRKKVS